MENISDILFYGLIILCALYLMIRETLFNYHKNKKFYNLETPEEVEEIIENIPFINIKHKPKKKGYYLVVINNGVDVINKMRGCYYDGNEFIDAIGFPPLIKYLPLPNPEKEI